MLGKKRSFYGSFFQYVTLSMISMAGVSLYVLADTFFIAQGLGTYGIAALNLLLPAFSLVNALGLMFGMGAATRYKIRVAEGRKKDADRAFTEAFVAAALLSIVFVVLGLTIPDKISALLGGDENTLPYMVSYLSVIWAFAPLFMLNNVMVAVTRNDNRPGLAMGVMLTGSLINVVLDWVFIFPMGLGMFGAALATGIAPTVSILILCVARLMKKNTYRFVAPFTAPREYFVLAKLGFSSFVNEISNGIVIIVFNFILLAIVGNVGVAAYGIITNIAYVVISLINGVAQGTQPLFGAGHGAGDRKICKKIYRSGLVFAMGLAIFIYALLAVFADQVIALFNSEENAVLAEIAKKGLMIYFTGMLPAAFVFMTAMYFNSTERPAKAIVLSLSRGLILIVPAALLLSNLMGIAGVWTAGPVTELLTAAIAVAFLLLHRKKSASGIEIQKSDVLPFGDRYTATAEGLEGAPDARNIREEVFVKEYGKGAEFDEFDDVATHALVRVGQTSVATGRLYFDGSAFRIGRVAVLKPYRNKGFGKDVVDALESAARDAGAKEVKLLAEKDTVGFYKKLKYSKDGAVKDAFPNLVPMKKKLK